ncbi:MAG: phytoene desaturase [Gammaproteobacteria bacterium]|nr:MAG: phytoene desaturase [Gammaproteobacteria bacterium]
MPESPVIIVGAGIGGLAAALELAASGVPVELLERQNAPGGKMRQIAIAGQGIDAGPTVLTMRWVFDELCDLAGTTLESTVALEPASVLARHAWLAGGQLDLHAEHGRNLAAIGEFAGAAEARRYEAFCSRAKRTYQALRDTFIRASRPNPLSLVARAGLRGLPDMLRISPFGTLWGALGEHFHDPRLRQLFGRYATYCGSSPFAAPATLMLIAHVELEGVWRLRGGMHGLAQALAALAEARGVRVRYGCEVQQLEQRGGRVTGVRLSDGEHLAAAAVVFNGDASALPQGLLGQTGVQAARGTSGRAARSLSALTWNLVARSEGFALSHHNVFFSDDYAGEFADLFERSRLPRRPTVYICAQDRGAEQAGTPTDTERLLCLVNAPAVGDHIPDPLDPAEIERCETETFRLLERCGLTLAFEPRHCQRTTPRDWHRLFPGTGGALYGQASHGWQASFSRPGTVARLPGLYLAGGSVHPGPGVPMAALSGRLAARTLLRDLTSRGT